MTLTSTTTRTLEVPGATLAYDVRPGSGTDAPLFLIGSPMGAAGFGTLAGHFADRTVITYDPRGADRSTKDDPTTESTPDQHADDLHRDLRRRRPPRHRDVRRRQHERERWLLGDLRHRDGLDLHRRGAQHLRRGLR